MIERYMGPFRITQVDQDLLADHSEELTLPLGVTGSESLQSKLVTCHPHKAEPGYSPIAMNGFSLKEANILGRLLVPYVHPRLRVQIGVKFAGKNGQFLYRYSKYLT